MSLFLQQFYKVGKYYYIADGGWETATYLIGGFMAEMRFEL